MKTTVLLTDANVLSLPPGEHWDAVVQGFGLVVGKLRRTFVVRQRQPDGSRPKVTIGYAVGGHPTERLTVAQARTLAANKLGGSAPLRAPLGLDLGGALGRVGVTAATITVAELVAKYLDAKAAKWSASHAANQAFMGNRIVVPLWGPRLAASITREDVRELLAAYTKRLLANAAPDATNPGTNANRLHSFFTGFYKWATKEKLVPEHVCRDMDKPVEETRRPRRLDEADLRSFWATLDKVEADPATKRRDRVFTDVWRLRLLTTLRETSIRSIQWDWISFEKDEIKFPGAILKNKKKARLDFVLPLTPTIKAIFAKRKTFASLMDRFVFATRDATSTAPGRTRGNPFALVDFQGKDLRRTAGTLVRASGISRDDLKILLNHKFGDVTDVYDLYEGYAEKRAALLALDRTLTRILDGENLGPGGKLLEFKSA